ncbi:MAG: hypothetical protein ACOX4D_04930 [Bacteroidales bacterium]|jgi:hypothetical protein
MKRFFLFLTTLILLPIALHAQDTDFIKDNSGFVWDSLVFDVDDGIFKQYGRFNGEPLIELIEPERFGFYFIDSIKFSAGIKPDGAKKNGINVENCTFKGKSLTGKVKIVEHGNADISISFVPSRSLADIVVELATEVESTDPCCTWQFVPIDSDTDFTININNTSLQI